MTWISLGVASAGATVAGIRAYKAHKAQKELQKQERPNYSISPEMQNAYQRAEGMTSRGFTGAEEAAFKANLGQSTNTAYRQAMDQSGGGMSQAVLGGLNARNVGALNQFAGQDAALRRDNIRYSDSLAGQLQGQTNLATGEDIRYRLMMEQAYGQAVQQNVNQAQSSLNYGGAMASGQDWSQMGKKDNTPTYSTGGAGANPPPPSADMYKAPAQQTYSVTGVSQQWPNPYQGPVMQQQQGPYVAQGIYGQPFGNPQGMTPTGSYYAPYNNQY